MNPTRPFTIHLSPFTVFSRLIVAPRRIGSLCVLGELCVDRFLCGSVTLWPGILILCLVLMSACNSEPKVAPATAPATIATDNSTLPPVALPDLSRMEKSVQQQVGERYRSLTAKIENQSTPPLDLSEAYGEMGNLLMAAEYFEAAEPYYLHAQALAPSEMRWPYYLGHVYMTKAEPANAVASFERALRLRPADVAALVWLGDVYLDQGQPESAEPLFAQALSLQPRAVAALFGLGRAALAKRDYRMAVDRFEQALSADPRASIVHYPLALAYRGLGDTAKAEDHLGQRGGVEVGPPDPLMVELRGLLHGAVAEENDGIRALDSGDFKAAAAHFRKGVELAPDNPSLRHKLGTALSLMGDTRGAFEQFEETVRRSPGFSQAHYSLGVLLAGSNRYQEALEHFSTAVRYEPNYVDARLRLAEILRRTGRPDAALAQYAQVIAIDPRVAEARFGYAMALVQLMRYDEARQRLTEGMRLHPDRREFADALTRLQAARGK
jgi:tetratricopeptide (TPR) repeat protein